MEFAEEPNNNVHFEPGRDLRFVNQDANEFMKEYHGFGKNTSEYKKNLN